MGPTTEKHQTSFVTDPQEAKNLLAEIVLVYEEVYAEPPYHEGTRDVTHFIERYDREHRVSGFRLAVSRDSSGHLSGFTYGLPLSSDTLWWKGLQRESVTDGFTREDGHRTFVIMELAVRAPWRRSGLARALHDVLVVGNPADRLTLAVRPEAPPAMAFYTALGYEKIGLTRPWNDAPTYQIMLRSMN